ncbi:hypothetical protein B0H13DRAFT_1906827 [Mycena leptocephala]|nr:hypothetical protein B0H13DRAFT_1906827 [Mycena leptocephala]
MSPKPTITQIRLNDITTCLTITADTLGILASSFNTPFLAAISNTTRSLLNNMQTIRQNKNDCTELMEQTYQLLDAIIIVHLKSDTSGELPPLVLKHIGLFTETLHKIHAFVETQQKGSKIKKFLRQGEMSMLLKECRAGLQQGITLFQHFIEDCGVQIKSLNLIKDITKMQEDAEMRHKEVLNMIEALSDSPSSDEASSISRVYSGSHTSSNSISMLPSEPKIFHGRESEVSDILQAFSQGTPRVAILGAGGMGKTTLARAILHHTEITARYNQHRFFIACDTATTQLELAAIIGAHLGLKPGKDLTRPVIQHFTKSPHSLLILDNLETLWEPTQSRGNIEEFLSLLTDVKHLALVITMRGAERPAKVAWTHPFLPLLKPLQLDAARKIFIDIADSIHDSEEVNRVLALTDNLPLAINLMAHLVDSEGCSNVLSRWEKEKTSLISDGYDRRSNLDLSISLSLSSSRLNSIPHSKELLSLLSILPDGLSDVELVQSRLPINNILSCKVALIRTTLAYSDEHKRLKALVPIREYMNKIQPPGDHLVQPLLKHFQKLLEFYIEYRGTQSGSGTVAKVSLNYSNIQNVLRHGLYLGRFYLSMANYYRKEQDISTAKKFCETAMTLALSTGNTRRQSVVLCTLAWIQWGLGDYSMAQVHTYDAQRLARISADLYGEAEALNLQDLYLREGNFPKARLLFERCMKLCKYSEIMFYCLERLGDVTRWDTPNWMSGWTTVFLVYSHKSKEKRGIHKALQFLGDIFLAQNDEHTAISLFRVALDGFTQMDVHLGRAECMTRLGDISKERGNLVKAMRLWETAKPLFERSSQAKQVDCIDNRLAGVSEDVLEQHKKNLLCLAESNVPSAALEDMDDLFDNEIGGTGTG